ncbi:rhodanese-like domain-containing protein [Ancylobacter terrae]|uniref:rhodanese-like domain-containing protein n=1 Tax=Ancylobacter sp. sgz301288 TaxID=3342077 RepID=UPI00385F306C
MNTHVQPPARTIRAQAVAALLDGGGEIAFIDVREEGQYGLLHPLLAVNIPYSRLERDITRLVPRLHVPVVLVDDGDGVAARAQQQLTAIGYTDVRVLEGGIAAWSETQRPLFEGENVPSKAFAEVVEHVFGTPHIGAPELKERLDRGDRIVVIDNRTAEEFERFHVPGAINAPGVDLVHRIADLVPSDDTFVVVSCAGRTRGIMGAQSLIAAGVPNRIAALEGGTQGWRLAGLELERGSRASEPPSASARQAGALRAAALIAQHDLPVIGAHELAAWRADESRTTYLFDVRSPIEYAEAHVDGARSAPGGQLLQKLDTEVAVRGAHLVLADDDGVRAAVTAYWLKQLGWEVAILDPATPRTARRAPPAPPPLPAVPVIDAAQAAAWIGSARLIAVTSSATYSAGHPAGSVWSIRPRLAATISRLGTPSRLLVIGEDDGVAALAAADLAAITPAEIAVLGGGLDAWKAAGLPLEASPDSPTDAARIDFLFWNHERHTGNGAHSRAYLEWEQQLPAQIEADGGAGYRLTATR